MLPIHQTPHSVIEAVQLLKDIGFQEEKFDGCPLTVISKHVLIEEEENSEIHKSVVVFTPMIAKKDGGFKSHENAYYRLMILDRRANKFVKSANFETNPFQRLPATTSPEELGEAIECLREAELIKNLPCPCCKTDQMKVIQTDYYQCVHCGELLTRFEIKMLGTSEEE